MIVIILVIITYEQKAMMVSVIMNGLTLFRLPREE